MQFSKQGVNHAHWTPHIRRETRTCILASTVVDCLIDMLRTFLLGVWGTSTSEICPNTDSCRCQTGSLCSSCRTGPRNKAFCPASLQRHSISFLLALSKWMFHRGGCNENIIFIIFIIFIFTRLRMFEARVKTNCAYNSIVCMQACKFKNEKNIFSNSVAFTYIVSNLMFTSGKFCNSAADHIQVKVTEISLCKCFRSKLTCWYKKTYKIGGRSNKHQLENKKILKTVTKVSAKFWIGSMLPV